MNLVLQGMLLLCPVTVVSLQDPPVTTEDSGRTAAPPVFRNRVRVKLDYHFDEENENLRMRHPNTPLRQDLPPFQDGSNEFRFDADYYFRPPPPRIESPLPMTLGTSFGPTNVTITSSFSTTVQQIFINGGGPRVDPPPPTKLIDSAASKSSLFGGADDPGEEDESDRTLSYGPTLTVPILQDASEWSAFSWLPQHSSLSVYARILFGTFEVFDVDIDMKQYSLGPKLSIPVLGEPSDTFSASVSISAGPAWLRTDVGDAVGVDTAVGLQTQVLLSDRWAFIVGIEVEAFFTDDFFSWGILPVIGLSLGL